MARGAGINPASARRAVARKLAMQALYRWQINAAPVAGRGQRIRHRRRHAQGRSRLLQPAGHRHLRRQRGARHRARGVDGSQAHGARSGRARGAVGRRARAASRAPDVPYRVVINEAVGLAKRFGATDSHKFVNAVLDAAARELAPARTLSQLAGWRSWRSPNSSSSASTSRDSARSAPTCASAWATTARC